MNKATLQDVETLVDMLTGKALPESVELESRPKLTPREAASVIWFLQEVTRVIPSNFEMCVVCHSVFDVHSDGYIVGEYDEWHKSVEVTPQEVEEHQGVCLCSRECELKFWRSL